MNPEKLLNVIKQAREGAKKRNFTQSFDLIVHLKELDLKKPEQQIEFFLKLPNSKGRTNKVCAFVGPELLDEAKKCCDGVYREMDFASYVKDKKGAKKISMQYDVFIAQANLMGKVAAAFGRILGPRGKMPSPKSGAVIPPKGNVKAVVENMKNTIKFSAKQRLTSHVPIGSESMKDEQVKENIENFYKTLVNVLPGRENNVKLITLKLTMGKSIQIE
ncbi:50S ribosomal protein L1 [Candidatus Woesearchaeota archaeon]|mgnify:FL=1|jgi:large subunit ribosomal protein L1|nr:50S ribosomal protein L1 [Candidatus Woesearchaeota archaeon]MBT4387999.1 50S ribosomal protein L1 [Candidatus Woesearchaeota archaeon]MBT4595343.1 50S ribosomal protein L1 [Candidatus Woesearchaeota archaeon]MBT5741252.1 50S ribosomal protein L1 [Candidatus Woesearchaeota archaeon]MBT6505852.1 50S ribosomal protein L1 [Candidatus Woesearchaeota archaeon]